MNTTKRILAFILASCTLFSLFSCADKGGDETESDASQLSETETETERPYLDDIPDDVRFDGESIRFMTGQARKSLVIMDEDDPSDVMIDAVWKRNQAIEDRLGVKLELAQDTHYSNFVSTLRNSVTSNANDYDSVQGHTRFNISVAAEGLLKNLKNVNYLDFDKSYWSKLYIDNINYKNNIYWAAGDISIEFIKYLYSIFVQGQMWKDYYPNENIYEIVREGKWTLDAYQSYSSVAYRDLNADGKRDIGDAYGTAIQKGHFLNGMAFSSEVPYASYSEDGVPMVALNNERTVDVFNKLHNLYYNNDYALMVDLNVYDAASVQMFTERRLLFCPADFRVSENEKIRDMEDDFYVIPMPKFDEAQTNYRTNQYDGVPIIGIPITTPLNKIEAVGATLEMMASMGSQMVIPTYYDKCLKNKYSRDKETAEMIDLIHDSITADFIFAWGDTIGSVYNLFYENIQKDSITSTIKTYAKVWSKNLDKLLNQLESNAAN